MADYSQLDKLLHRLALDSNAVAHLSFDLERKVFSSVPTRRDALYVTGLARAGTTTLMRGLYESGKFSSITYGDMPFVLAPNLWRKLSRFKNKRRVSKERAHGDGIYVDFDSPEALEEVFWRIHCGDSYIKKTGILIHKPDPQTILTLKRYQDLVCFRYGRPRYLAKNNNHIMRLRALASLLPDTIFLVLFRDPLSQAQSLLRQHNMFANPDSFTRIYMSWLGHYEFGATHRPFQFSGQPVLQVNLSYLQYWIDRWIDAYGYLLGVFRENLPNVVPVSYQKLCTKPGYWAYVCDKVGISKTPSPFRENLPQKESLGTMVGEEAQVLYDELERIS